MAKATKNKKPRVRIKILNLLIVILGADLILLFAPGIGILNFGFTIGDGLAWSALIAGIILLVIGFKGLYQKQD